MCFAAGKKAYIKTIENFNTEKSLHQPAIIVIKTMACCHHSHGVNDCDATLVLSSILKTTLKPSEKCFREGYTASKAK